MYQCVCDRCGKSYIDDFNGYVAWSDETYAAEAAWNALAMLYFALRKQNITKQKEL